MARNFYFGADATMVSGSASFASLISVDPPALGLTVAQCEAFAAINATLQSAYQVTSSPTTRTPVAVQQKNAAVKAMQRSAVNLARIISSTQSVTDGQLIALGLLRRPQRTRRHVPQKPPAVEVLSVKGRVVKFRIYDPESESRRRKPFGAQAAQVFSYVGEESPGDPRAYHFEATTSRTTTQVTFPNDVPSGATVWLIARWVSARGETSIGGPLRSVTLQGGPIGPATVTLARAA